MLSRQQSNARRPAAGRVGLGRFVLLTLACCAGWLVVHALASSGIIHDVVLTGLIVLASVACVFFMSR